MSNELTNEVASGMSELFESGALSVPTDQLKELENLSRASTFLQRIQFYSKGKNGPQGTLIQAGHYGVPSRDGKILDLGNSIDVVPIFRKPKAIDMSDTDHIVVTNVASSETFRRIEHAADNIKDSGCAYGPTYLVYERSTKKFYEFFCGNSSGRAESATINTYLPVTQAMIDEGYTDESEPRFAKPMNLSSRFVKKGTFEWFAPVASDCLTPFDLPPVELIKSELERFKKLDEPEVEVVDEANTSKRKR